MCRCTQLNAYATANANPLLHEVIDRINFHPLRAPAEDAVGRRVASSKATSDKWPVTSGERALLLTSHTPRSVLYCWPIVTSQLPPLFQQVGVNIQVVLLGALAAAAKRAFDHFGVGGNRKDSRQ